MSRSKAPVRVSGDRVPALLHREAPVEQVLVDPPPRSWAAIKPAVVRALSHQGERRLPQLVGYPLCAVGESWRALAPITGPKVAEHAPCQGCALAERCSPPLVFNTQELQPFGSLDPGALWKRFHARFCEVLAVPKRQELDALVAMHLDDCQALPGRPVIALEPSLVVKDRVEPRLRLAIFHGRLPTIRDDSEYATHLLLDSWSRMHEQLGEPVPYEQIDCLRAHSPFQFPIGFEAEPNGAVLLKGYVRLQHFLPDKRERLVRQLCTGIPTTEPRLDALADSRSTFWDDVQMVGLGTRGGRLASLKLYVLADTQLGWSQAGLPAIDADHPLERLSNGRAYAVIDLAHPTSRPPKWDYFLRERLFSGPMLADFATRLFSGDAADQLVAMVDHQEFRVDVVAAALRGDGWAFYTDIQ